MTPEDGILDDLKALAESDRGLEAPASVEAKLRPAFRHRKRQRSLSFWRWIPAVAAAAILAVFVTHRRPAPPPQPAQQADKVAARQTTPDLRTPVLQPVAAAPRRAVRTPRSAESHEIATEFFPLVAFAPQSDGGELVRVNLPASAMREVGLPVREDRLSDRVQADVLVNDGMATAIRFVKFTQ